MRFKLSLILIIGLMLIGCGSAPPRATETEYVVTEGASFLIEHSNSVKYGMNYLLKKDIGHSASYLATFENPRSGGEKLVSEGKIEEGQKKLIIQSPELPGIENNREYNVTLSLYSNGELVTEHHQLVQFSLPKNVINQLNIIFS